MIPMILTLLFIIIAYLFGSVSSAIVICKILKLPDPRTQGSHNPGATNVLRLGGKSAAAATLLGDVLKGFIPVLIAKLLGVSGFSLGLVAIAAFLGHLFPLFFAFKGGKGVATFLGVLLALSLWLGLAFIITWLIMAFLFRYSSLSALVASILTPVFCLLLSNNGYLFPIIFMVIILFIRHHQNISDLLDGKEGKLFQEKS